MKIKRPAAIALLAALLVTGAGCGKEADGGETAAQGEQEAKKVALVIAQGGLGDRSYNDLANEGFERALDQTGVGGQAIESNDVVAQAQPILERASSSGFGLVVDLEFSHADALKRIAAQNPEVQYGFLNAPVEGSNVTSVLFAEHEGSYLAGMLAALMTTQEDNPKVNDRKVIGVIGGTKSTGIDKFIVGYIQGARDVDPDVKVLTAYANNFGDPAKGKQIANSMFDRGADIVYHVAGGTGAGVIEAAKDRERYAIGVDTDQDATAPGYVLTSMIKRADLAVERLIGEFADGSLKGGRTITLALKEQGVGLSEMKHTKDEIPQAVLDDVEGARERIVSGELEVWDVIEQGYPDFYKP
jgi:basic membrane protein A